jgi:sugar/nucleoside kinase (ribokinase family)
MTNNGTAQFDVLGLGCASVDDVLYVSSLPRADGKVRVESRVRRFGGLTATALIAAARLGARCAYAGCLGVDDLCQSVAENLSREGVDLSHAPRLSEAHVIHSVVIVARDTGGRNVFYQADGAIGAHPSLPPAWVIRASKVLLLDHCGMAGNLRAACIARKAEVAVVADFEDETEACFVEVLDMVDHLILPSDFARRLTATSNAADAAMALWRPDRTAVIVTCGTEGCWSVSGESGIECCHHPAFSVETIDTTGCGDVFHGAYAAAAQKAAQPEIPRLVDVEQLIHHNNKRTTVWKT